MCMNIHEYLESTSGPFYDTHEYSYYKGMIHEQTIYTDRSPF